MKQRKLLILTVVGFVAGGLLAEEQNRPNRLMVKGNPLSIVNTVRTGYDDNPYRNEDSDGSFFIEDSLDLAYRAALSARTDASIKVRLNADSDDEDNGFYPNVHGVLNHAVSPRLLLQFFDTLRRGNRNGDVDNENERADYWNNKVGLNADYVLTSKDRLGVSASHQFEDNDNISDIYDYVRYNVGASWSRELLPDRTQLSLNYDRAMIDYDKLSDYDADSVYGKIGHTFNPNWNGYALAGATYVTRDGRDNTAEPKFGAGLAWLPSPRTRLSVDGSYSYEQTDNSEYSGQTQTEVSLGVEHDLTARITLKSAFRYRHSDYDDDDRNYGWDEGDTEDDRYEWDTRVSYKINRINFVELGYKYAEKDSDTSDDWDQNRVSIGWRVEI
jgi:hypothetical protein